MATLLFCVLSLPGFGQEVDYTTLKDIQYYSETENEYIKERCVLDLYYPTNLQKYPTIVWFHGGGLTGGNKETPNALKAHGFAVITANYRLSPKIRAAECIKDAAAVVAWVFEHIEQYGGSKNKIIVSGHSAGGYLASMVGLDKSYLAEYDIDADMIAALVPFSGHAITHFTIRAENNIPGTQAVVDAYAPLYHVRKDAPPYIIITGDREMELLGRYEENAYMARMMQLAGHKQTILHELEGYGHQMTAPAFPLLLKYSKTYTKD
ncbi:MAG: alpha/beta hydrolase [Bacteroidota bacterium]